VDLVDVAYVFHDFVVVSSGVGHALNLTGHGHLLHSPKSITLLSCGFFKFSFHFVVVERELNALVAEKPSFLVVVVTVLGSRHWYKITLKQGMSSQLVLHLLQCICLYTG
jgi:hypothetical protein